MNYIEVIGYIGSVLVALSLMMKNIYYLRRINLIGAATFSLYGILVNAYPVFLLNGFIALVDIYYIVQTKVNKEYFTLLALEEGNSPLLKKFLEFYRQDITQFFPNFNEEEIENDKSFFILRNLIPVGLFVYKEISPSEILIELDYAIPDYRDLKNARFVYFAQSKHFTEKGYKIIHAESNVQSHKKYLQKVGFKEIPPNSGKFVKQI